MAFDSERGSAPHPHSAVDTITPPIHIADDLPLNLQVQPALIPRCAHDPLSIHVHHAHGQGTFFSAPHRASDTHVDSTPRLVLSGLPPYTSRHAVPNPNEGQTPHVGLCGHWCIAAMDWQAEDCKPFSTAIRRTVSERTASRRTASAEDLRACDRNVRQGPRADGM